MLEKAINLSSKFHLFKDFWSPRGVVNIGTVESNLAAQVDQWI